MVEAAELGQEIDKETYRREAPDVRAALLDAQRELAGANHIGRRAGRGIRPPDAWRRAFEEIDAFEEQLAGAGTIVLKFWPAITPDEQLRRFQDQQTTPYKQYKITEEDRRNRDRWDAYVAAACEMIEKTSTEVTPWILVEANNKEWARVKTIKAVVRRLEEIRPP